MFFSLVDFILFPIALLFSLLRLRDQSVDSIFAIKRPDTNNMDVFENLLGLRIYHSPRTQKIQVPRRIVSIHGLSGRGLDVSLHLPGFGLSDRAKLSTSQYGFFLNHFILKYKPQIIIVYGWSVVPLLMALGNLNSEFALRIVVIDPLITHEYISFINVLFLGRLYLISSIVLLCSKLFGIIGVLLRKWNSVVEFIKFAVLTPKSLNMIKKLDISHFKPFLMTSSLFSYMNTLISSKWNDFEQRAFIISEYPPIVPWIRYISRPSTFFSGLSESSPNVNVLPEVAALKSDGKEEILKNADFFTLRSLSNSYTTSWDDLIFHLQRIFHEKQIQVDLYGTEFANTTQIEYFERLFDRKTIIKPFHRLRNEIEATLNKL